MIIPCQSGRTEAWVCACSERTPESRRGSPLRGPRRRPRCGG